jgi:hypothetical protein
VIELKGVVTAAWEIVSLMPSPEKVRQELVRKFQSDVDKLIKGAV